MTFSMHPCFGSTSQTMTTCSLDDWTHSKATPQRQKVNGPLTTSFCMLSLVPIPSLKYCGNLAGDTTWLPYYQITHLQEHTEYLDLLGLKTASKLPKVASKPPQDNPQIFVGAISTLTPTKPIPVNTTNHQHLKSRPHTAHRTQLPHSQCNPIQFLFTASPN